jgi:hypothetical protein
MIAMGLFSRRSTTEPVYAAIGDTQVSCLFCSGDTFRHHQVEMRPGGPGQADLGWANDPADALICSECGYVHQFHGRELTLWSDGDRD